MSIFVRDRGKSLKRLHRPNRFRVWLNELEGESGSQRHDGLGPVYLNAGLMKPRRGFTLAAGEEKPGVGNGLTALTIDSISYMVISNDLSLTVRTQGRGAETVGMLVGVGALAGGFAPSPMSRRAHR